MRIARTALILTCLFISHTVLFSQTPADYADPRLGVSNSTFAGPALPFGMVQFSPIRPDIASDVSRTLVHNAQEREGGFGQWLVANDENGIMIGEPTTPSISAMYGLGAMDIDIPATLAVMRKVVGVSYTKST